MKRYSFISWRCVGLVVAATVLPAVAGCTKVDPPVFHLNLQGRDPHDFLLTGKEKDQAERDAKQQNATSLDAVATVLYAMFGEPNAPFVLPETGLDPRKIELAAGRTGGDETGRQGGLYRQHCAHCHGISGDGAGPTAAFLNPYPRDYRQGAFKFKSTARADKPTTEDLHRILHEGIAGTAMPSFLLLADDEIDALSEYVKYLSIRGQTEQLLLIKVLDDGDSIDFKQVKLSELVSEYVTPIAETWASAESAIVVPPDRPPVDTPEQLADSIAKGAELFRGAKAQCAKCHGPTALGDGSEELLFDDWNKVKQFADLAKKIADAEAIEDRTERSETLSDLQTKLTVEDYKWLLPQQQIQPRNLRLGTYRFGRRPVDLYRRIFAGVNGTPMPQAGADANNPSGLTPEEIWHIVAYVRSLPYDKMSEPGVGKGKLAGLNGWHE
ncbi:MAG TPA: cytochrome c [Pirellulales bacterium]|jgi:mono/diheme cytochrome c family protein